MGVIDTHGAREVTRDRHQDSVGEDDQGAQIRDMVAVLARRRGLVASVFILVFAAVAVALMMSPRRYEATALVMVNPAREQVLAEGQMVDNAAPNSSVVDSEIEILRSQMLMRELVTALELADDPEWNAALRAPGPFDAVIDPIMAALRGQSGAAPRNAQAVRNAAAVAVARAIIVRRRGMSYGIEVSVETGAPESAARIANGLVEIYLRSQTEARFETAQRANSWLETQLVDLRRQVQEAERQAEAFRQAHGLSLASGTAPGAAGVAQSSDVQTMLVTARADLAEKEARLRQVQEMLRGGGSADSLAGALTSPVIGELRTRETELARQAADMGNRYSSEHPDLLAVRTQLNEVQTRIREETSRISENLRNEVQIARARLGTLQGSFGVASGTEDDNEAVVQYRQLVSDATAARAVHESFLQRYHEVSNQGELPTATSRLISSAEPPAGPSKPRLSFSLLIAFGAAFGIGVLSALMAEVFDGSMSNAEDVERKAGIAAVASIPVLKAGDYRGLAPHERNPIDYLVQKPMSAFAEALRVMRTSIMHARLDRKVRVLAITSAVPNEGKTTLSASLTRICAMSGQRVLLVDCDLRRQTLSEVLDIKASRGLVDVLRGEADWRQCIVEDREGGAHILPAVSSAFTPRDLFSSPAMEALIADLRQHYDLVVLDCAPVLAIAETRLIVAHADAAALVARSGRTHAGALRTALREVEKSGVSILGVALNCVDPHAPGRGTYGDTLYYRYAKTGYYTK